MANSKSRARAQAQQRARAQAKKAAARTAPPARATPTSPATRTARPATPVVAPTVSKVIEEPAELEVRPGPPLWFQVTTFVLAIIGLGISAYETYAHYSGQKLLGCPAGSGTFNCQAVITSSQSMVFGAIPVAVLGLAFYVFAVPIFSPWAWRFTGRMAGRIRLGRVDLRLRGPAFGLTERRVGLIRLGSLIVGMGFVMYLIYAEVYQIGQVCEYCTGVHIVTFVLFCMTVVAAAIWGLGDRGGAAAAR